MFGEKANIVCWCIEIFTLDGFIATVTGFCFFLFSKQVEPINLFCWTFTVLFHLSTFVKSTPGWLGSKVHFLCKSNFFIFTGIKRLSTPEENQHLRISLHLRLKQELTGTRRWNHHRRRRQRWRPDATEMSYWWGGRFFDWFIHWKMRHFI